jgi:hypothetical protein
MPMAWRRIAWFVSFALALILAAWMRSQDFGWLASLGAAGVTWVILSQLSSAFVLWRRHRRYRDLSK